MAWYQRSYLKFTFIILILLILQEHFFIIECVNLPSNIFLHELNYNKTKIFFYPGISEAKVRLVFDYGYEYFINNPSAKFSVCRYYQKEHNILQSFNRKSPLSHPNLLLINYENCNINLQFTHCKINNFSYLSHKDIFGKDKIQFISNEIHIYPNFPQFFLNFNDVDKNLALELYDNYELLKLKNKNSLEVQNFLNENDINIKNCYNNSFIKKIKINN